MKPVFHWTGIGYTGFEPVTLLVNNALPTKLITNHKVKKIIITSARNRCAFSFYYRQSKRIYLTTIRNFYTLAQGIYSPDVMLVTRFELV